MKRKVVIRRTKPRKSQQESAGRMWRSSLMAFAFLLLALLMGGGAWLWRVGWVDKQLKNMADAAIDFSRRAGFSVQEVLVEGRKETDRQKIIEVLDIEKGSAILAFDPQDALKRLSTLSWVGSGTVERRLPDTILVRLAEREPIAVWQINKKLKLIDREGHVLRDLDRDEDLPLPHVVGVGANSHAAALLKDMLTYPAVLSATSAAVRVSNRRWNLHMQGGIVVKLPEDDPATALKRLNGLIAQQNILSRDILGLDLRLPERMIVETRDNIEKTKADKGGI